MSNYWAERQALAQSKLTTKSIRATEEQLKKYYRKSMEKTLDSFEKTYNKIFHNIQEGQEITPADLYKLDKYWEMQGQLQKELERLGDKQIGLLTNDFKNHYEKIYNSIALKGEPLFNTLNDEMAQQMINEIWCADGKTWSQRVWVNMNKLKQTLNDELLHCVITGAKPTVLRERLTNEFDKISRGRANTLIRTEMAHIQTQAAKQRYLDYGLTQYEILGREEDKCGHEPDCNEQDGERYYFANMKVGENAPPFHPNCRCCIVPVVD